MALIFFKLLLLLSSYSYCIAIIELSYSLDADNWQQFRSSKIASFIVPSKILRDYLACYMFILIFKFSRSLLGEINRVNTAHRIISMKYMYYKLPGQYNNRTISRMNDWMSRKGMTFQSIIIWIINHRIGGIPSSIVGVSSEWQIPQNAALLSDRNRRIAHLALGSLRWFSWLVRQFCSVGFYAPDEFRSAALLDDTMTRVAHLALQIHCWSA